MIILMIVKGHFCHFPDMVFVSPENPDEESHKKKEENDKGDERKDLNPRDGFHMMFDEFQHFSLMFKV
jgi:hypothetical protein